MKSDVRESFVIGSVAKSYGNLFLNAKTAIFDRRFNKKMNVRDPFLHRFTLLVWDFTSTDLLVVTTPDFHRVRSSQQVLISLSLIH